MQASLLLAASVLATLSSAQTSTTSTAAASTVSQSMPAAATQGFDSSLVTSALKSSWCTSQLNVCPKICGGTASTNTCDPTALTYDCVCSNGTTPDVTAYIGTLPFFICEENFKQCIDNHPNDLEGQDTCKKNEVCGSLNATEATASTSTATTAAATSSSASGSASSTASASGSESSGNAAITLNTELATGAFAGLLFAAFKLLL